MVMGGDSCTKDREFKSQRQILDGHFFTYIFVVKFVICLKRQKNILYEEVVAGKV